MSQVKNFDWTHLLKFNILVLRLTGLWPLNNEYHTLNLYTIWTLFYSICLVSTNYIFEIINLVLLFDNIKTMVIPISFIIGTSTAVVKIFCMIKNSSNLRNLLQILQSDMCRLKNARQINLVQPSLFVWKIINTALLCSSQCAMIVWTLYPLLKKSNAKFTFPYIARYPWPVDNVYLYIFFYIHQSLGIWICGLSCIACDALIAVLNVYIGAQFDILCDDIRHLFDGNCSPEVHKLKFISCVKHHKEIVRFAKNANDFSNWIILIQFFLSGLSIATALFQLAVLPLTSSEIISSVAYSLTAIIQIFFYCYFGNEVEAKSSKVVDAVFESNWPETTIEIKKLLIFFLVRCQTPVKVSALNLFYLTLNTFMSILRTSWSSFSLLSQMSSR